MSSPNRFQMWMVTIVFLLAHRAMAQIPDSPQGFDQQLQAVFDAYKKADGDLMKSRLKDFAIPKHWFADVFVPHEASGVERRYTAQFAEFESQTVDNLLYFDRHNAERLDVAPDNRPKPQTKPAPASLRPLPDAKKFTVTYVAKRVALSPGEGPEQSVVWADLFVYIDGQFRFFGRGAYPFWDPARTPRVDPCAGPGEQTGGELVKKIDPLYPARAEAEHVEGVVKMHITVSEAGSVKEVVVVEGNPLLAEAAKAAVLQWRFQPLLKCGNPVQMRTFVQVSFPSP